MRLFKATMLGLKVLNFLEGPRPKWLLWTTATMMTRWHKVLKLCPKWELSLAAEGCTGWVPTLFLVTLSYTSKRRVSAQCPQASGPPSTPAAFTISSHLLLISHDLQSGCGTQTSSASVPVVCWWWPFLALDFPKARGHFCWKISSTLLRASSPEAWVQQLLW